jgi:toxin ParE1/3/4
VAKVRFSRRAEADFDDIAAYTVRTWDAAQADRYLAVLENYCQRIADTSALGRACDHIRPGLQRAEHASHVVFFRRDPAGIVVCRVLHKRMLPEAQPIDEEDAD